MNPSPSSISFRLHLIDLHYAEGHWRTVPTVRRTLAGRIERAWADVALERLLPSEEFRLAEIAAAVQGVTSP